MSRICKRQRDNTSILLLPDRGPMSLEGFLVINNDTACQQFGDNEKCLTKKTSNAQQPSWKCMNASNILQRLKVGNVVWTISLMPQISSLSHHQNVEQRGCSKLSTGCARVGQWTLTRSRASFHGSIWRLTWESIFMHRKLPSRGFSKLTALRRRCRRVANISLCCATPVMLSFQIIFSAEACFLKKAPLV